MRYYIDSDDDGHGYVIPVSRRTEWDKWMAEDAGQDSDAPDFARPINGSPSLVEFENPTCRLWSS